MNLRFTGVIFHGLCSVALSLVLLSGCGTSGQSAAPSPSLPPSSGTSGQSTPVLPTPLPSTDSQPPSTPAPAPTPLPVGQLLSTNELLLAWFDWENPEHLEGRATTASEPRVNLTVRVVDKDGNPVPMLSCDYDTRRYTDNKGEAHFEALYNNPLMLSLANGKSGMNIEGNSDYWVDYRLTVLEGARSPVLELIWEGVTPQQTIDAAADRIEIVVTDNDGKPITGAMLWLEETYGEGEPRPDIGIPPMLTNESGRFIWCNSSKGDYTLTCQVNKTYISEAVTYRGGIVTKTIKVV